MVAYINIEDKDGQFKEMKLMLDSLSSNIWLVSNQCTSDDCVNHEKINNKYGLFSNAEMYYTGGKIKGFFDLKTINLNSFSVVKQPILIANQVNFPLFKVNNI